MKINNLFLLLLSGVFIIAAALTILVVNQEMRDAALAEASVKSRLILNRNLAIHTYFSQDMKPSLFAWSEPFRSPDYFEPTWMSSTHAVRAIDQYFKQLSPTEYYYKECAINARSPQNEADEEEHVFITRLNEDEGAYTPGRIWVMRAIPIRNEEEQVVNVIQIARDITNRKNAQNQIQEQLHFLQDLMEAIPNPIFFKDAEGRYQGCNRAFEHLFNLPKKEILGKTVDEFAPVVLARRCRETDQAILKNPEAIRFEETMTASDGTAKHLVFYKAAFSNAAGESAGIVGSIIDATARRRLEEQLRHTDKMQAIGSLAGGIAHDFNNILAIILGYSEIALMELGRSSHESQCLLEIIEASRRAKELIKQILSFSRRSDVERRPLLLGVVVQEALRLLRASLPATIEMRQELQSSGLVKGDPTEIHQIVMNLCTNAYQAMKGEAGVLEVALDDFEVDDTCRLDYHDLSPGHYVRLMVRDSGCGIEESLKDRIFDPYFTTKPAGEGTGLGLAIVHGIVMAYGGSIHVESKPGRGTHVAIYLPIIKQAPPVVRAITPEETPGGTERVLFVDDEEHITTIGKGMLEILGYRVSTASSGEKAWQVFQQDPDGFDVIVTDMTMPQLTGVELAQRVVAVRPGFPVVLCSGYSDLTEGEVSQLQGVRAYLAKPFDIRTLAATLRKVLNDGARTGSRSLKMNS